MKNFFKIMGIILIIAGSCLSVFTDVTTAEYVGIAMDALGLALAIIATWSKSEKKDWKVIVSVVTFAVGGFLCGIAGFADSNVSQIIMAVVGVVSLIAGLLTNLIKKKDSK